jgi:hypothetical protein
MCSIQLFQTIYSFFGNSEFPNGLAGKLPTYSTVKFFSRCDPNLFRGKLGMRFLLIWICFLQMNPSLIVKKLGIFFPFYAAGLQNFLGNHISEICDYIKI